MSYLPTTILRNDKQMNAIALRSESRAASVHELLAVLRRFDPNFQRFISAFVRHCTPTVFFHRFAISQNNLQVHCSLLF